MYKSLLAVYVVACLGMSALPLYAQAAQTEQASDADKGQPSATETVRRFHFDLKTSLPLYAQAPQLEKEPEAGASGGGMSAPPIAIRKGLNFDVKAFLAQADLNADVVTGSFKGDSLSYRMFTLQLDYFPRDPWGATFAYSFGKSESFLARFGDNVGKEDRKDLDFYIHYSVPEATRRKVGLGKYTVLLTPGYKRVSFEHNGSNYEFGYKGPYIGVKVIGAEVKLSNRLHPIWYVQGFVLPFLDGTDNAGGSDGNGGGIEVGLSQSSFGQKYDLRYVLALRWQRFGGERIFPPGSPLPGRPPSVVATSVAVQDTFFGIVLNGGVSF